MNGLRHAAIFFSLALPLAGCAAEPADEGAVGTAEEAYIIPNALVPAALLPPGLPPSELSHQALSPDALAPGALAAIQDPGEAGALSRMFVQYAVSCALTSSQSFSFTWTDSSGVVNEVTDPGDSGLEPGWAHGPLTAAGQELVSACLAARTNYYGDVVLISMRSDAPPLDTMTTPSELAAYPDVEGAFWGNLFAPTPALYACYDPENVANDYASQRECAVGHVAEGGQIVPCGPITLTGPCAASCAPLSPMWQLYPACLVPAAGWPSPIAGDVITTALP